MSHGDRLTHLASPCRNFQILSAAIWVDPADGALRVLMQSWGARTGELIILDPEAGSGETFTFPEEFGNAMWGLVPLSGEGRETGHELVVLCTALPAHFLVFDLTERRWRPDLTRPMADEWSWTLRRGNDGRLYSGTSYQCHTFALDPRTWQVEDMGRADPLNCYDRTVLPTGTGWLIHFCGYEEGRLVLTREDGSVVRPWGPDVPPGVYPSAPVVAGGLVFMTGRDGLVRAYDPGTLEEVPHNLPPAPAGGRWDNVEVYSEGAWLFLKQGDAIFRWRAPDGPLTLVHRGDLHGGWIMAVLPDGRLFGVRGQDYFVLSQDETLSPRLMRPLPGPPTPANIQVLEVLPNGDVWGSSRFGQTMFVYHPGDGTWSGTSVVVDGGGEVNGIAGWNGKLLLACYSGADLAIYDPGQPWDQWHNANPRVMHHLAPKMQRPQGLVRGRDGCYYSGWMGAYGHPGGFVTRWNPETGALDTWDHTLLSPNQSFWSIVADEHRIYIGSTTNLEGRKPETSRAAFVVLDRATSTRIFYEEHDSEHVDALAFGGPRGSLVVAVGTRLRFFDVKTLGWVGEVDLGPLLDSPDRAILRYGLWRRPDGSIVVVMHRNIVAMDAAGIPRLVARPPREILAACLFENRLYLGLENELWACQL